MSGSPAGKSGTVVTPQSQTQPRQEPTKYVIRFRIQPENFGTSTHTRKGFFVTYLIELSSYFTQKSEENAPGIRIAISAPTANTRSTEGDAKMQRKLRNGSRVFIVAALVAALALSACGTPETAPSSGAVAGTAVVTWEAPTTRMDGTPLTNIAGYKVYYRTAAGNQPPVDVGNTTTYTVTGLQAGETYIFRVTTVDLLGNESSFSNEVSKTIPPT